MRIRAKVTQAEIDDIGKMVRPKMYWPKLVLPHLGGFLMFSMLLWATATATLEPKAVSWEAMGAIWAVVAAIFVWSFYSTKKSRAREFAEFNDALTDWITVDGHGLGLERKDGAHSFEPWANFKGIRKGRRVVLIDLAHGQGFIILPMSTLSDAEQQQLLGLLEGRWPQADRSAIQNGLVTPEQRTP